MPGPNVLWIVLDAVRSDHLGCYGAYPSPTPFIDHLAAEGLLASVAVAQSGWSLPSYATMLTGLYPSEHGAHTPSDSLADGIPMLQERLLGQGYRTASIGGNPFLMPHFGMVRGFGTHRYINRAAPGLRVYEDREPELKLSGKAGQLARYLGLAGKGGRSICDAVVSFVASSVRQPWFCFVPFMTVHEPYTPPWRLRRRHCGSLRSALASPLIARYVADPGRLYGSGSRAEQANRELYCASVAHADSLVERLLNRLQRRGALANTIVIICSDHGEFLGERDLYRHLVGLGEPLTRVPLILWSPDHVRRGVVSKGVVELRDVPHTLCPLLGVPPLKQGRREALDLLGDEDPSPSRVAFSERRKSRLERAAAGDPWACRIARENHDQWLVRDLEWEYLEDGEGMGQLYHVAEDPAEATDLCGEEPDVATRLCGEMAAARAAVTAPAAAEDDASGLSEDELIEVEDRLRQLGYL